MTLDPADVEVRAVFQYFKRRRPNMVVDRFLLDVLYEDYNKLHIQ